jgi:hypothetical protein
MPPNPPLGNVSWKLWLNSGVDAKFAEDLLGEGGDLLHRRVGGHVDLAEDDPLVLGGRQLLRGEHVHGDDQQRQDAPDDVDGRAVGQRDGQHPRVTCLDAVEHARRRAT